MRKGREAVIRGIAKWAVVASTAALVGCGVIDNTEMLDSKFWANSPLMENTEAELGLAELGKGNYAMAETHFRKALKRNPQDVHALLGMGILYQNTGQSTKAREMYEAILAIRPDTSNRFVVWNTNETRPVADIAGVNLALLESGDVVQGARYGAAGVTGTPTATAMMGRGAARPSVAAAQEDPGPNFVYSPAVTNIVERFKILATLRDEGLITNQEYQARRQANIGALLPLTSPPPAAGLDRPVPSSDRISGRLRAIGRALEMRAITVSQHGAERQMILDALMPAAPVTVANPVPPPQGLMEAADAVRRLEEMQKDKLISSDEYSHERAAVERSMQPEPPRQPAAAGGVQRSMGTPGAPMALGGEMPAAGTGAMAPVGATGGPQAAVHLASFRSKAAAEKGWTQMQRSMGDLVGKLNHQITEINLGPGKGIFFRLKAGPLASQGAAEEMCRKLKGRRQYCEPTFMDAG